MDGPAPLDDRSAVLAAAREMGIVPGDPAYPFVEGLLRMLDRQAQQSRQHEAQIDKLLAQAKAVAGGQLAHTAADELPRAIDRLVLQRYWFLFGGMLLVALLMGAACGYWYRAATYSVPVTAQCQANQPGQPLSCTFRMLDS